MKQLYTLKHFKHNFLHLKFKIWQIKKSCQKQDPFQNINPNITLEIKSFLFKLLGTKLFGSDYNHLYLNTESSRNIL